VVVGMGFGRVVGSGCGGGAEMVGGSSLMATVGSAVGTLGSGSGVGVIAAGGAVGAGGTTLDGVLVAGVGGCAVGACCGCLRCALGSG
jgi:hypothetical protein